MQLFGTREPQRSAFRFLDRFDDDTAKQLQALPTEGLRRVPSDLFLWAAGGSVLASIGLRLLGRRDDALWIGEWAPTMLTLGVLARLAGR